MKLIERIEDWHEGGRFEIFHPTYGPFPDFAALYEDDDRQFMCGAWIDDGSWVCMVEGPRMEGPEVWTAGFLSTYRWWRIGPTALACRISGQDWDISVPHEEDADDLEICEYVVPASIELYTIVQR